MFNFNFEKNLVSFFYDHWKTFRPLHGDNMTRMKYANLDFTIKVSAGDSPDRLIMYVDAFLKDDPVASYSVNVNEKRALNTQIRAHCVFRCQNKKF